jgi:hypothetical protein
MSKKPIDDRRAWPGRKASKAMSATKANTEMADRHR